MKKLLIILVCALMVIMSCTKSKKIYPEIGDGNEEVVTVGVKDVYVEYARADYGELSRIVFHYCPADSNGNSQQYEAAEMTKKESFFELTLNDLLTNTLYWYYFELFFINGNSSNTVQKTFHTLVIEQTIAELPIVVTGEVFEINTNSVHCSGEVISDGGVEVTERGICWSTNANPTLEDGFIASGTGTGEFTVVMSGLGSNTTYHVRAYATNEAGTAYGMDVGFTTISGGGFGEHEYVDLGLPSGLLWATYNVGANSPEEYGAYFAWGETSPKSIYNWNTYNYCYGTPHTLIKYCISSDCGYNGFTDNLIVLQPMDDAATANWGNNWRMPTKEDWQELLQNASRIWTTKNGVEGSLFTATNGNSLFLPAAGDPTTPNCVGNYGLYWSSSLLEGSSLCAWSLGFRSDNCGMNDGGRDYGFSVRAVSSIRQN